jgi:hypothetical protein
MNQEITNRGRMGRALVCFCLTLLLIGFGQAAAQAQTRLVKPSNGGTIFISKAGSYFLGSNLVTTLVAVPAIGIKVNNVTINLNGFAIVGPGGTGTASGIAVAAGVTSVTIFNGTITKIRGAAIVLGSNSTVSALQLVNNGGDGIDCTSACLVTNNIISNNTGTGLNFTDATSGYQNNIISGNGATVVGGTQLGTNTNVCNGTTCP